MAYFFAYGERMNPEKMYADTPGAKLIGPAHVEGYRLEFNVQSRTWGGGAANAVPDRGGMLWGMLWEVSDEDLARFDSFRGEDVGQHRVLDVEADGPNGPATARTFLVDSHAGYIRPTERYAQMLRAVVQAEGLPPEALAEIDRAGRDYHGPAPSI
jgi:Gamma-glutamyl cyclotransferase, AIG2-like